MVLGEILREVNLVLVMTINPGFGRQRFLEMTVPKIRQVRGMIEDTNPNYELELDGGIDSGTAPIGVAAGADVLVVGRVHRYGTTSTRHNQASLTPHRQRELKDGAPWCIWADPQPPVMSFDNRTADCQAHAHPERFGGIEGFEHTL